LVLFLPRQGLEIIGSDSVSAAELAATFGFLDAHGLKPHISGVLPLEKVRASVYVCMWMCMYV
jgi:D-arabinose 1-dehydrogenase-like Zn-dependent alcohol dehydrogenase